MNPRVLILIVIAAALAIYFAAVKGRPKPVPDVPEFSTDPSSEVRQETIDKFEIDCDEPEEEPDISVQVEVDRSKGKNRLYFTLTEAHGFYVDQFRIKFWFVRGDKDDPEDSPLVLEQFFDRYMPAKENLRLCLEVVPAELRHVGGDIGETKNWRAELVWHNRWCAKNPSKFPPRTDIEGLCD